MGSHASVFKWMIVCMALILIVIFSGLFVFIKLQDPDKTTIWHQLADYVGLESITVPEVVNDSMDSDIPEENISPIDRTVGSVASQKSNVEEGKWSIDSGNLGNYEYSFRYPSEWYLEKMPRPTKNGFQSIGITVSNYSESAKKSWTPGSKNNYVPKDFVQVILAISVESIETMDPDILNKTVVEYMAPSVSSDPVKSGFQSVKTSLINLNGQHFFRVDVSVVKSGSGMYGMTESVMMTAKIKNAISSIGYLYNKDGTKEKDIAEAILRTFVFSEKGVASDTMSGYKIIDSKTYTNTDHKFSLEYPASLLVREGSGCQGGAYSPCSVFFGRDFSVMTLYLQAPSNNVSFDLKLDAMTMLLIMTYDPKLEVSWSDRIIAGMQVRIADVKSGSPTRTYFIQNKEKMYIFSSAPSPTSEILSEIEKAIATFKYQ